MGYTTHSYGLYDPQLWVIQPITVGSKTYAGKSENVCWKVGKNMLKNICFFFRNLSPYLPYLFVGINNFLFINNNCTTKKHRFMKKFFTIAALAAAMCGAAQAQETVSAIYIAGAAGTEINGQVLGDWDIVNTLEVTPNRGKFVLTIKNFSAIAISDKKLTEEKWGEWKTGLWSYPGAADMTDADLNKPFPMSGPGEENGAGNVMAPWKADVWEVEIAGDLSTITYRTSTPKPADVVHLLGNDPIGWNTRDEYQFENEAGTNVYWLDITEDMAIVGPHVNLNIIVNGDWEIWWGGATKPLVFDEPQMWGWKANVGTDNDYVIPDGTSYWGTIRFVRPAAGEPAEVTMYTEIKEHKSEPNGIETVLTDEDATPEYFTLQGLRVGSPQQGQIYIVRQGSKVSKVYYR